MAEQGDTRRAAFSDSLPVWARIDAPTRQEQVAAIIPACLLVPLGSFANHLPGIGLGPLYLAALIGFAGLAVLGLLVAGLCIAIGKQGHLPASALLGFIAVDFHLPAASAIVAAILALAIARWKGVLLLRVLWVIFALVLLTSLLRATNEHEFLAESGPELTVNRDLPPLIHVVLDEVAPELDLPDTQYSHWERAYSRYHVTAHSLPEMLGTFHDRLIERGYALDIWSNYYYDACRSDQHCTRYWHHSLREAIEGLSPLRAARMTIYSWLRSGSKTRDVANFFDSKVQATHTSPVTTMKAFDAFAARASNLQPGQALTFHALLPHYPYAFDADCTLREPEDWVGRFASFPIAQRKQAYRDQLTCVKRQLARLYRDDAVIVIHGDHGTRMFDSDPGDGRSPRDEQIYQAFRTAFALHLPGGSANQVGRPATVSSLLEELAASDFRTLPKGKSETVFLGIHSFRERKIEIE